MNRVKHVALLHAYSRRNSGDGLLVDLSVKLLREAFGDDVSVTIVAADPASFADYDSVLGAPVIADRGFTRVVASANLLACASTRGARQLARLLDSVDLIVGVGGGYLRARNATEALKLEAGHILQMRAARASGKPAVYLPQSIGPANAGSEFVSRALGQHLAGLLGGFSSVFVRDDRSFEFLKGNANTRRAPDLAVLEFGARGGALTQQAARAAAGPVGHVAMVLREAPSWNAAQLDRYRRSSAELIAALQARCRVSFAVQSTGRGNDDAAYYRRLGIDQPPSLRHLLAHDRPDVVISVRLHGALESILDGVPAFHLSYERKGFGAYGDLGVDDWVVNAADFAAMPVVARIFAAGAIERFWAVAARRVGAIRTERERIVAALRDAARVSQPRTRERAAAC
ncbi:MULTISPECIES: polysaccharide pyruvyl transferase family protein [Burkholderia]|uniref:polysaccharide pyruvyl transferase family protein n=1 Tax=Burkholderia TaxID=32008 RepID=UPI0008418621|nr:MULTISPECIES: polysaccharide pyruvyl transferase family protein [unclassified Burkholderia]AOK29508.1 polysaccharide pyruvyl transferase [Burkholderia sp. Bp7605]